MQSRIETLRGGACLLLVIYHVIGAGPNNGLRVIEGDLRTANDMLALIRMPLFAFIAGWVYAMKPVQFGSARSFLWKKTKRLLIPMICVGGIFILTQRVMPGVNSLHSGVPFIRPVAHLWFVQALFVIFAFVALLDALALISSPARFAFVFFCSCTIYLLGPLTQVFALGGAIYLLPFFLVGVAVGRYPHRATTLERPLMLLTMLLIIALSLYGLAFTLNRHTAPYLIVGVAVCAIAASSPGLRNEGLVRLGEFSFSIYLFHVFFTAGARILLESAGVSSLPIHLVTGVMCGIAGPVFLELGLRRHPVVSFLLLGKRLPLHTTGLGVRWQPVLARLRG